jgi:mRNA interferase RelE/StbE
MNWRIVYRRSALRKLASLPVRDRDRIFNAITRLAANPYLGTPLKGELTGLYKYRIGDWRVIYELRPEEAGGATLVVRALGARGDIYK